MQLSDRVIIAVNPLKEETNQSIWLHVTVFQPGRGTEGASGLLQATWLV